MYGLPFARMGQMAAAPAPPGSSGDEVFIPAIALTGSGAYSIPAGSRSTAVIVLRVQSATDTHVTGPAIGYVIGAERVTYPQPMERAHTVPRGEILLVLRNNLLIAEYPAAAAAWRARVAGAAVEAEEAQLAALFARLQGALQGQESAASVIEPLARQFSRRGEMELVRLNHAVSSGRVPAPRRWALWRGTKPGVDESGATGVLRATEPLRVFAIVEPVQSIALETVLNMIARMVAPTTRHYYGLGIEGSPYPILLWPV